MKRWNIKKADYVENLEIDIFLHEIIAVCKKHGFSLSHEDGDGAFGVDVEKNDNFTWLLEAYDNTQDNQKIESDSQT